MGKALSRVRASVMEPERADESFDYCFHSGSCHRPAERPQKQEKQIKIVMKILFYHHSTNIVN